MQSLDDSKMIKLIYSLSDQEFKELGLWVHSPIHNSSEKTIKLYQAIKNRKNQKIEPLYLLKKIGLLKKGTLKKEMTTKDFQDLRKIASKLTIQIEQFLIWKQNSKDTIRNNRVLMDQMISRQLFDLTQPVLNKSKKELLSSPLRDIQYCKNQYKLDEIQFYLDLFNKNRTATDSLKQVVNSLQDSCLSQLLRYYGAIANSKNLISSKEEFQFMSTVKDYLGNRKDVDHFTTKIYYNQLVLLEKGGPSDYFAFKNLLFSSFDSFSANELRQFFGFMANFCGVRILNGDDRFLHERLEIYKKGLAFNCWTAGVYFSRHQFINIVKIGIRVNENAWVKEFVKDYSPKLDPGLRQNTLNLCNALLEFENEAYAKAQQLLFKVSKSEDFIHHSLMEVLLMKIYYSNEKLTFENFTVHPIHARIKAFQAYLNFASGSKLSTAKRDLHSNFIQILKQMIQTKKKLVSRTKLDTANTQKMKDTINKLNKKCQNLNPLTERTWLLKQIEELQKENS